MSLQCSCGCGGYLSDSECRMVQHGTSPPYLETMRTECIQRGRGNDLDLDAMEQEVWDYILANEGKRLWGGKEKDAATK